MNKQTTISDKNEASKSLILPTLKNFILGVIALGAVLFLPAWTLDYWQAWVFIAVFMVLVTSSGVYFSIKDPALIERRKLGGRRLSNQQKIYMTYIYIAELGLLVLPALDHRWGWSRMPASVSILGDGLVALATLIWLVSKKENSYAGAAIRIYEGQKVVTTGPYALVRHPNYVGDLALILGIPLALGSWWALIISALVIPAMVWMIFDEEAILKKGLAGYEAYTRKVHYRLVPYLW